MTAPLSPTTRDEKLAQVCANCGKTYAEHTKVSIGRICDGVLFRAKPREAAAALEAAPSVLDRLRELAGAEARRRHNDDRDQKLASNGRPLLPHELHPGAFETCPQADCRLVRAALEAAPNGDHFDDFCETRRAPKSDTPLVRSALREAVSPPRAATPPPPEICGQRSPVMGAYACDRPVGHTGPHGVRDVTEWDSAPAADARAETPPQDLK